MAAAALAASCWPWPWGRRSLLLFLAWRFFQKVTSVVVVLFGGCFCIDLLNEVAVP